MQSVKDLNKFMFSVVNQITLEEFKKYTNFRDIIQAILVKKSVKELDKFIELNFKKNIPNKDLWLAGGFSSLKLTDEFYESKLAARLFHSIYGIKECELNLVPVGVQVALINECETETMGSVESKNNNKTVDLSSDVIHREVNASTFQIDMCTVPIASSTCTVCLTCNIFPKN